MNKNILIGALMLVAGLGIGYTLTSSARGPQGAHMMPDGSMMRQNIDQHFIVEMIPHHQGAIDMANLALERTKRPEVLALANAIIESQQKEIEAMRAWHTQWFGSAPTDTHMGAMHMDGMTGDQEALKALSGPEFDREFVTQMIPHHEMAVMMAQMLAAATERPEMKQLASDIISSQTREIDMMRGWLKSW